jgi:hypothetical protein
MQKKNELIKGTFHTIFIVKLVGENLSIRFFGGWGPGWGEGVFFLRNKNPLKNLQG